MVTYDIFFHFFPTFAHPTHVPKITRLNKIYTFQQGSIPYQKEISVQSGEILLEISYWKLWTTLQCDLKYSLILSLPIQSLTWRLHLCWFMYTKNKNVKQEKLKGDRQQLINFRHKGKNKLDASLNLF